MAEGGHVTGAAVLDRPRARARALEALPPAGRPLFDVSLSQVPPPPPRSPPHAPSLTPHTLGSLASLSLSLCLILLLTPPASPSAAHHLPVPAGSGLRPHFGHSTGHYTVGKWLPLSELGCPRLVKWKRYVHSSPTPSREQAPG